MQTLKKDWPCGDPAHASASRRHFLSNALDSTKHKRALSSQRVGFSYYPRAILLSLRKEEEPERGRRSGTKQWPGLGSAAARETFAAKRTKTPTRRQNEPRNKEPAYNSIHTAGVRPARRANKKSVALA